MKKSLLLTLFSTLLFSLSACNLKDEYFALNKLEAVEKVWVFMQINVRESDDGLDTYYYYAQISKEIYTEISNNALNNGFILLSNTKYWGDDDLITEYKNTEHNGELVFRIEHIVRISTINKEPIAGQGAEQFYNKAQDNSPAQDQDSQTDKAQESSQDDAEKNTTPALPKIDTRAPIDNA